MAVQMVTPSTSDPCNYHFSEAFPAGDDSKHYTKLLHFEMPANADPSAMPLFFTEGKDRSTSRYQPSADFTQFSSGPGAVAGYDIWRESDGRKDSYTVALRSDFSGTLTVQIGGREYIMHSDTAVFVPPAEKTPVTLPEPIPSPPLTLPSVTPPPPAPAVPPPVTALGSTATIEQLQQQLQALQAQVTEITAENAKFKRQSEFTHLMKKMAFEHPDLHIGEFDADSGYYVGSTSVDAQGTPFPFHFYIRPDDKSPGGYEWSLGDSALKTKSGTLLKIQESKWHPLEAGWMNEQVKWSAEVVGKPPVEFSIPLCSLNDAESSGPPDNFVSSNCGYLVSPNIVEVVKTILGEPKTNKTSPPPPAP